ncbi:MAG TPA: hypothetical protein VKK61_02670, partial [Tepidisphaeraceae bacterium]|nr:hypothetical protein [Tepidisphaeraceae bacterium]
GLFSMILSCGGLGQSAMYQMGSRTVTTPSATQPPIPIPPPVQLERINSQQRRVVMNALSGQLQLSQARQAMLDKLLMQAGDQMFSSSQLTEAMVSADVSQSGRLPGVNGEAGNDYFIITSGRIEIADDHAVFSPIRGDTVRVYSDPMATQSAVVTSTVTYSATTMISPKFAPNAPAMLYGIESLLHLLLALLLLVGGIVVLASTGRGRGLHLTYAWIKIPLAILTAITYVWMRNTSSGLWTVGPVTLMGTSLIVVWSILEAFAACIYPVALLLVMRSATARDYYTQTVR